MGLMKQNPVSPEDLANAQLEAYNRRDLEGFLNVYSEDVEVYTYPNQLQYAGRDRMRMRYAELFSKSPELHAEVIRRMVLGKTVVDQERVRGRFGGDVEAIAMYTVENGAIVRAEFVIERRDFAVG